VVGESSEVRQEYETEQGREEGVDRNNVVPRDKHTTRGNQARLAPMRSI